MWHSLLVGCSCVLWCAVCCAWIVVCGVYLNMRAAVSACGDVRCGSAC